MDFKNIVERLISAGWTQHELASECDCGQSTLSDILSGKTKEPRFSLAKKLIDLSKESEQEGVE